MCKILRKTELLKARLILANIVKFLNSRCFKLSITAFLTFSPTPPTEPMDPGGPCGPCSIGKGIQLSLLL